QQAAIALRDHIRETTGLPVTIGIGRTRTLAKLFSDTAKPFGAVAVLDRDREREILARLPVTEVSGIAGRRAARLAAYSIRTCLELADANRKLIRQVLTQTGEALWWELNGEPIQPLQPQRPAHQTIARGGSMGGTVSEPAKLWAEAVRNLERLIEELEFHEVRAGRITVWLSYKDQPSGVGESDPESPTNRFDSLLDA